MKSQREMGLIAAGDAGRSFLARLSSFTRRLGPVKSSSYRLARKIRNSLRAGRAVSNYSNLQDCDVIWVAVPDAQLSHVLRDLGAQTPLRDAVIVICESAVESLSLAVKGCRVATLNVLDSTHESTFVAEGHPAAVKLLRSLLAQDKKKLIELKAGTKPLYFAGLHMAEKLLLPWAAGATECLRSAGFTRAAAVSLVEALGNQALRANARAGSMIWNAKKAAALMPELERELDGVRRVNPRLGTLYEKGVRVVESYF